MKSMKKTFLVASIAVLVGALMVGCGNGPVTEYMKKLDPIIELSAKGANAYATVDLQDPEAGVGILQNEVIPAYEEYLAKLNALTDTLKDEKLKQAHAILVSAAQGQLRGYQVMLTGLAEGDIETLQEGEAILVEATKSTAQFQDAINALLKK